MDARLDQKFPCAADMERAALKRMPRFIRDYIFCGMGLGGAVQRNRDELDRVKLCPRYLTDADHVNFATTLFDREYDAPFGVAPVGMGGLAWPKAGEIIAGAARQHNIPFGAATYTTATLESLHQHAGPCGWFQFYHPNKPEVADDVITRAKNAGYDVLMVTVDVPANIRRDHDTRNGFAIPPRLGPSTVLDLVMHPVWSIAMARSGIPAFENLLPYIPEGLSPDDSIQALTDMVVGHVTPKMLRVLRRKWPGTLLVKGILDPEEAVLCKKAGVDGVVVSNHGGRQLEAAPAATEVLPAIRKAVGPGFPLIADGGVRTGLDICRMLALGADFVLMGRPYYYAVAAMGEKGADHLMNVFKEELRCTMGQLGCSTIPSLRDRLVSS